MNLVSKYAKDEQELSTSLDTEYIEALEKIEAVATEGIESTNHHLPLWRIESLAKRYPWQWRAIWQEINPEGYKSEYTPKFWVDGKTASPPLQDLDKWLITNQSLRNLYDHELSRVRRAIRRANKSDLMKIKQMVEDATNRSKQIAEIAWAKNPSNQSKIVRVVERIIVNLEKTNGKVIPIEDITAAAQKKGINDANVETALRILRGSGDIFEPKRGHVSRI